MTLATVLQRERCCVVESSVRFYLVASKRCEWYWTLHMAAGLLRGYISAGTISGERITKYEMAWMRYAHAEIAKEIGVMEARSKKGYQDEL